MAIKNIPNCVKTKNTTHFYTLHTFENIICISMHTSDGIQLARKSWVLDWVDCRPMTRLIAGGMQSKMLHRYGGLSDQEE